MTTQEVLYAEVKPDISTVATPLFEVSERCLRDMGNFLPHAAVLTEEGKVEIVGAVPDSKDGYADSTQVLPLLHDGLRAMAKEKALVAIGIAENVTITPTLSRSSVWPVLFRGVKSDLCWRGRSYTSRS